MSLDSQPSRLEQTDCDKRVALRPILVIRKSTKTAPLPEARPIAKVRIPVPHGRHFACIRRRPPGATANRHYSTRPLAGTKIPANRRSSGLDCWGGGRRKGVRGRWRIAVLLAAADADYGLGEIGGEAEPAGAADNLRRSLTIDKRFRDDEARTQRADSRVRGHGHSGYDPFMVHRWTNRDRRQPTANTSSENTCDGSP